VNLPGLFGGSANSKKAADRHDQRPFSLLLSDCDLIRDCSHAPALVHCLGGLVTRYCSGVFPKAAGASELTLDFYGKLRTPVYSELLIHCPEMHFDCSFCYT